MSGPTRATAPGDHGRRAAVVVNPTKVGDLPALREQLTGIFRHFGWQDPAWSTTTADEPGETQTRQALDAGADLIVALGGDGTVRCAATALLGTGVPLAILAGGTGNLFARQLRLPVGRYGDALRVALSGIDEPVDAIRIALDPRSDTDSRQDHIGLVMGGVGLDADIMAATSERLKSRLSWAAYLVAGLRHLRHELMPARIRLDDRPEISRAVTAVLVGNCGLLQGGVRLMPDAVVDDGLLDAVVLRGGGARWVPAVGRILVRSRTDSLPLSRAQVAEVTVSLASPHRVEVDGDVIGAAETVRFRADQGALVVRRACRSQRLQRSSGRRRPGSWRASPSRSWRSRS